MLVRKCMWGITSRARRDGPIPQGPATVLTCMRPTTVLGPSLPTIAGLLRPMWPIMNMTTEPRRTQPRSAQAGPGRPGAPCHTRLHDDENGDDTLQSAPAVVVSSAGAAGVSVVTEACVHDGLGGGGDVRSAGALVRAASMCSVPPLVPYTPRSPPFHPRPAFPSSFTPAPISILTSV